MAKHRIVVLEARYADPRDEDWIPLWEGAADSAPMAKRIARWIVVGAYMSDTEARNPIAAEVYRAGSGRSVYAVDVDEDGELDERG